jgi:excinuclease ABC subunit C
MSWRIWHWTCILKKLKKSKKIEILENYQSVLRLSTKITNIDDAFVSDDAAYVNFLQISHGSIIRSHINQKLETTKPMRNY